MAVKGFDNRVLRFVGDYDSSMPSCAPVYKVKDCKGVDEHYVTFHLVIESVWNVH